MTRTIVLFFLLSFFFACGASDSSSTSEDELRRRQHTDGGTVTPPVVPPVVPPAPIDDSQRVLGVTIDNIDNLNSIITALKQLPTARPTVRVVFDEYVAASYYLDAVKQLSQVANVMGELLDSAYLKQYSVADYKARSEEYLQTLGDYVSIWEIGNEVNGEWLGTQVMDKILVAYTTFTGAGKKVSVNFYYNKGCSETGHEMFEWINAQVPSALLTTLDWVLFSYYEDDCSNITHDATYWEGVFTQLGGIFPTAKLGFGEVGTSKASKKVAYAQRYYSMKLANPRFIGGYFWWYFYQDRNSFPGWISSVW